MVEVDPSVVVGLAVVGGDVTDDSAVDAGVEVHAPATSAAAARMASGRRICFTTRKRT